MSKASWLPAHVYGNGYVGIGSKGICSWVIAETREILLLYTILFAHVFRCFSLAYSRWDRYLGMTAVMTQVPTAILSNVILLFIQI